MSLSTMISTFKLISSSCSLYPCGSFWWSIFCLISLLSFVCYLHWLKIRIILYYFVYLVGTGVLLYSIGSPGIHYTHQLFFDRISLFSPDRPGTLNRPSWPWICTDPPVSTPRGLDTCGWCNYIFMLLSAKFFTRIMLLLLKPYSHQYINIVVNKLKFYMLSCCCLVSV